MFEVIELWQPSLAVVYEDPRPGGAGVVPSGSGSSRAPSTVSAASPSPASLAEKTMLDYEDWSLTFADNFDSLRLWDGSDGTWKTTYVWGDVRINRELQYYVDPRVHGINPIRVEAGVLSITARPTSPDMFPRVDGRAYTSGLLTTERSFAQEYGYVEIRARVPRGRGLWPAFWMLPRFDTWPSGVAVLPEIDVLEVLGHETTVLHNTVHTNETGSRESRSFRSEVDDLADGFHVYGVVWQPNRITWYLDGRRTATTATPDDVRGPFYLLVNLAVGGDWPGAPDASTRFPAVYEIDHVRVYRPARP